MTAMGDPQAAADHAELALARLSSQARRSNLARVDQLSLLLGPAGAASWTHTRTHAAELAHQIVGSAGTFGYPEVSALAGQLEDLLCPDSPDSADQADLLAAATGLLDELRSALSDPPAR